MRVFVLRRLEEDDVMEVLRKAVSRVVADEQPETDAVPVNGNGPLSSQLGPSSQDPFSASQTEAVPSSSQSVPEPSSSQTLAPTQDTSLASSQLQPLSQQDTEENAAPLHASYPHTTPRLLRTIAALAAGDARTALGLLELGT